MVALFIVGCGATEPRKPGQIVYQSWPDPTDMQIDAMEPDGTGQHRLTPPDGSDQPSWSPDGKRIAFTNYPFCDECSQICTMNADGSGKRCLTPASGRAESPAWSPDGGKIAYARWKRTVSAIDTDIVVMRTDGSNKRPLTSTSHEDSDPAWSPDGDTIVFSSNRDAPKGKDSYDLYAMRADGTDIVRLTSSAAYDYSPDVSPDGDLIAFTRTGTNESGLFDLWVMSADGSDQRVLF